MTIFAVLAGATLRALLGRRRTLLMLLLAATPVLLGLIVRLNREASTANVGPILDGLVIRVVLPLIALVFGTASLGAELDDGTAVHILTKPIDRSTIVLAKVAVAGSLTATLVVPATVFAGILMGGLHSIGVTLAVAFAVLIGSYVYVAIFVALSVVTSRGLIIGLAYSLIWEGLLAGILPGSQIFSVREYLGGIASVLASQAVRDSLVGAGGFLYAGVTFGVALLVASARLATYEIRGSD